MGYYSKIFCVAGLITLCGCGTDVSRFQKQLDANGYGKQSSGLSKRWICATTSKISGR